jgi:hypothetical protein
LFFASFHEGCLKYSLNGTILFFYRFRCRGTRQGKLQDKLQGEWLVDATPGVYRLFFILSIGR